MNNKIIMVMGLMLVATSAMAQSQPSPAKYFIGERSIALTRVSSANHVDLMCNFRLQNGARLQKGAKGMQKAL